MASPLDQLAEKYLRRYVELDPTSAPLIADPSEAPAMLTDYGPEGTAARADLARHTLAELSGIADLDVRDRVAAGAIADRLSAERDQYSSGSWMVDVGWMAPPLEVRRSFEQLNRESSEDWERVVSRLDDVPRSLGSYRRALEAGIAAGTPALRTPATATARRVATVALSNSLSALATEAPEGLRGRVERAAVLAEAAYGELGEWLEREYLPKTDAGDRAGRERYSLACRFWLGAEIDPDATYAWGIEELGRIRSQMVATAHAVRGGAGIDEAAALLDSDPARCVDGTAGLIAWVQDRLDATTRELDGAHFEIPAELRRIEVRELPRGTGGAPFYNVPSPDFSRPGRVWWPSFGDGPVPLWNQVASVYHEGVPGHHLQAGYATWLGPRLNAFQRILGQVSGHCEGWGLYAERLMDELGYFEDPGWQLGLLTSQAMRAARVVVDIGLHLGLVVPAGEEHAGSTWTAQLAARFMASAARRPEASMAEEIERYLGMPAQAITYKVGEREWLRVREAVRHKEGSAFDLKRFHRRALALGHVGLAQLESELVGRCSARGDAGKPQIENPSSPGSSPGQEREQRAL